MKILVTGSGGFIGKNLVSRLGKKYEIKSFLFHKQKEEMSFLKERSSEVILGDVTDERTLKGILEDIDVVINLSAQRRGWETSLNSSYEVNVLGTKNIINESIKNDVEQFIHCSTSSVIGPVQDKPLDENYNGRDTSKIYYKTKLKGDRIVLSHEDQINTTIIMPTLIYGPHDDHHLQLFKAIRDKKIHFVGRGDNIFQPGYIDDCIKGFDLSINNEDAYGEEFIIGGNKYKTTREIIYTIANVMDKDISPLHIPRPVAQIGCYASEFAGKIFGFQPKLRQRIVDWFTENHFFDISKAEEMLNFKPQVGLKEGIEKTVNWYKENDWL